MYITFSYLDKPTKAAAKSISKNGKKFSLPFGKEKYSIQEANHHLQALSKALFEANHANGRLSIVLTDSEGIVETAGTSYEFGPVDYSVDNGLGASLIEVIQKDIYADTDENMSFEESYRNDKLIEQLDKAIEEGDTTVSDSSEDHPWEEKAEVTEEINELDLDQEIQAERAAEQEIEEFEQSEEPEEQEASEERLIQRYQDPEEVPEKVTEQFFDYEAYISPISDSSDLFAKQDAELEELTSLNSLLSDLPEEEPWLNEKMRQFLQTKHSQSDVSNLKQVFDRTRQEALAKTRSLLAEQYKSVQEDKVEERAYSQLAPTIKELEEQFSDELQQFVGALEEKWQSREQDLLEKEAQEIERISKEIKSKYERIKNSELEEKENKIAQFTAKKQTGFAEDKEQLLEQERAEIIKEHDEVLTQVRIEAKKETEDHIKKVFTNAIQVIQEKNKSILSAVNDQVKIWKEEHQKELLAKEEAAEKERKEIIKQQRMKLQQEQQALRKKELQLKEMELGKETKSTGPAATQPFVVAYPPNNDQGNTKTDLLIESLRNELRDLKEKEKAQSDSGAHLYRKKLNRLLISCIVLSSLTLGGISVGVYNHFSGSDVKAEVQSTSTAPIKATTTNKSQEPNTISSDQAKNTESVSPDKQVEETDQDKIREFLFQAGNKDQLESFNNAYPSVVGDLEVAILNNHAVNALKAYEKLSDEEKKELGQAQKIAVRAYYTANNEIPKAEEVK